MDGAVVSTSFLDPSTPAAPNDPYSLPLPPSPSPDPSHTPVASTSRQLNTNAITQRPASTSRNPSKHLSSLEPVGLVSSRPPPPEDYEFNEMTLSCRYILTDQWLTTRVDTAWTIAQTKLHMLNKLMFARRDLLKLPGVKLRNENASESESLSDDDEPRQQANSNGSSVIFSWGEGYSSSPQTQEPALDGASLEETLAALATGPSSQRPKPKPTHNYHVSFVHGDPSLQIDTAKTLQPLARMGAAEVTLEENLGLEKDEVLDHLLDKMEANAKQEVLKVVDQYCLMTYSNGNILDDTLPLTNYRLRPYELLEMQRKDRIIGMPRDLYLEPYWELPVEIRLSNAESQAKDSWQKFREFLNKDRLPPNLREDLELVNNDQDVALPPGTAPPAIDPDADRKIEAARNRLVAYARKEISKQEKLEKKAYNAEKWMNRQVVISGHQLHIWRDMMRESRPTQSWDLRSILGVSTGSPPKPSKQARGSRQTAYDAIVASGALIGTEDVDPNKTKNKEKRHELHLLFPSAAAANVPKAKNTLQKLSRSPSDSSGNLAMTIKVPDEHALENLSRVIHRAAGSYPIGPKRRRTTPHPSSSTDKDKQDSPKDQNEMVKKLPRRPFNPFPEWRTKMLHKCVASGRMGFMTSPAWQARYNSLTGMYEDPTAGEGYDSDNDSLVSEIEWQGWRDELQWDPVAAPLLASAEAQKRLSLTAELANIIEGEVTPTVKSSKKASSALDMLRLKPARDLVLAGIVGRTTRQTTGAYAGEWENGPQPQHQQGGQQAGHHSKTPSLSTPSDGSPLKIPGSGSGSGSGNTGSAGSRPPMVSAGSSSHIKTLLSPTNPTIVESPLALPGRRPPLSPQRIEPDEDLPWQVAPKRPELPLPGHGGGLGAPLTPFGSGTLSSYVTTSAATSNKGTTSSNSTTPTTTTTTTTILGKSRKEGGGVLRRKISSLWRNKDKNGHNGVRDNDNNVKTEVQLDDVDSNEILRAMSPPPSLGRSKTLIGGILNGTNGGNSSGSNGRSALRSGTSSHGHSASISTFGTRSWGRR